MKLEGTQEIQLPLLPSYPHVCFSFSPSTLAADGVDVLPLQSSLQLAGLELSKEALAAIDRENRFKIVVNHSSIFLVATVYAY